MSTSPVPLRPDPNAARRASVGTIVRSAIKAAKLTYEQRGAMSPLTLSTAPSGAPLLEDFLATLQGQSAASQLFASALQLSFGSHAAISVPQLQAPSASNAAWVGEGSPIPVYSSTANVVTLTPHKLATSAVFSSEMLSGSNAEKLVTDALSVAVTMALDEACFDNNAATSARPAGLRHNLTPLTPASTGDAMATDIAALLAAVSPVSANLPVALISDPAHTMKMLMRAGGVPLPIFTTVATSMNGLVLAVASATLVSVLGSLRVEPSRTALVHLDTVPGSDPMASAPSMSLWQQDSTNIKLVLECDWGLRDSKGAAVVAPTGW